MAFSFASIGSQYTKVKSDKLNPADRAYLDECRRSSIHLDVDSARLQPHPLASSKPSINPYHESFRQAQSEAMQQRILRRAAKRTTWSWKRTFLLTIVLTIILTTVIIVACVNAKDVSHVHYVQYFSMLIGAIILGCFAVMIISKLYPWINQQVCKAPNNTPESSDLEDQPPPAGILKNPNVVITAEEPEIK